MSSEGIVVHFVDPLGLRIASAQLDELWMTDPPEWFGWDLGTWHEYLQLIRIAYATRIKRAGLLTDITGKPATVRVLVPHTVLKPVCG